MKIIWSPKAKQDLDSTIDIISKDKASAAILWSQKIYKKVSRLQRFPHSGRMVPELGRPEIRELIVGNFRIIYKINSQISVLTIFRGTKNL